METGMVSTALQATDTASTGVESAPISASYEVNLSGDAMAFADSLERAGSITSVESPSSVAEAVFAPLDMINNEARDLAAYAQSAIESGNDLSPSEIVTLTTRSQEFMFYSQLTANVANRTADGLQQLFRQQS